MILKALLTSVFYITLCSAYLVLYFACGTLTTLQSALFLLIGLSILILISRKAK